MASSKKDGFSETKSAPGSEAAQGKWFLQTNVPILRKSSAPGSEAARDKWFVQKQKSLFEKSSAQAAKLPGTSDLLKKTTAF